MLKELLKILPLGTIIISYLFICGGLYQIGYWGTFDVDSFSLIQIWDIPKNFIVPFMLSGGISIFVVSGLVLLSYNKTFKSFVNRPNTSRENFYNTLLFSLIFVAAFIFHKYFQYNLPFWIISLLSTTLLLEARLEEITVIKFYITNFWVRKYILFMFSFTFAICFLTGKKIALLIYNNERAQITRVEPINNNNKFFSNDNFKLLGFLGDKFIVSSLDNKRLFILNQSAYDVIEITDTSNIIRPKEIKKKDFINIPVIDTTLEIKRDTVK